MSGGHFNYIQNSMEDVVDEIQQIINTNEVPDEYGYAQNYTKNTISKFKSAQAQILKAAEMIRRIDWLVSGDDGEDYFHKYWKENISKINKQVDTDATT